MPATPAASATPREKPREKPLRRAVRALVSAVSGRLLTLCWVTYALGVVWVLLHPAVTVTTGELKPRGTYMSENALLVDSMDPKASHREETRVREWHAAFLAIPQLPPLGCGHTGDCARVVDWLETQLRAIDRVDAFRQRFQVASDANGTNVYGILKAAPLADHKESIVLVTHYRNIGWQATNAPYSGVALGLALLEFLADAKWLAKDVILVFADDGESDGVDGLAPGTDAWLRAYHLDPLSQASESSLPMRAGLIRAAINLETIGDLSNVDVVGVFTAGINGQLPNLDLVNTVVSHTTLESVPVVLDRCLTVQQTLSHPDGFRASICDDTLETLKRSALRLVKDNVPEEFRSTARDYVSNLAGMLRFMKTLATGPSGLHGSFISYNIDAVTFAMTKSVEVQHWQGARSIRSVLRSLELVVRSLSNLEEKLHQSFFLYVLPNNHDFISVGEYYYTVALAVSPAIMHLILTFSRTAGLRVAFALAVFVAVQALSLVSLILLTRVPPSAYTALLATVTCGQLLVVFVLVPLLRRTSALSGNSRAREWIVNLQHFDSSTSSEKTTPAEVADSPLEVDRNGWRAIKCVLLTLVVYAHCILGILNYPMALFCALPMAFFAVVEPFAKLSHRPIKRILFTFWLVVSSPFAMFVVASALDGAGTTAALSYFVQSFSASINILALPYLCCLYIPVHTLALAVWFSPIHAVHSGSRDKKDTIREKQQ